MKYNIAILLFISSIINCNNTVYIEKINKKYCKYPYIQEWNDGCIKINGQILTPELMVAMELEREKKRVERFVWDSLVNEKSKTSMISFRIRIEPYGKCIDTIYSQNSDIVYGFGRSDHEREKEISDYRYSFNKRIWMNYNNKRIDPFYCHTEQNFGIDNGRDLWVGFRFNKKLDHLDSDFKLILFFQNLTPLCDMASLEWSSALIQKLVSGGRL